MKKDARYALLVESIAEINARLRILDEANARLEATVERQLELIEILVIRCEQLLELSQSQQASVSTLDTPQVATGTGSCAEPRSPTVGITADRFIDRDTEYSRATHPALFKVIDLLATDEQTRTLSVRQLAQQTGVSKSWCAVAKRYMLREESVH